MVGDTCAILTLWPKGSKCFKYKKQPYSSEITKIEKQQLSLLAYVLSIHYIYSLKLPVTLLILNLLACF
jgi:hypothetical protein